MITILIVDDEKNIRAGIHKILSDSIPNNIQYLEAKNGVEALEIVESSKPDLMITDIRMPKMDGLELMNHVATLQPAPAIIVLSGYDEFAYAKEAIRHGVVSYILKPIDRNELIKVVVSTITEIEKRKKSEIEKVIQQVVSEGRLFKSNLPGNFSLSEPFYFAFVSGPVSVGGLAGVTDRFTCYMLEVRSDSICFLVSESEKAALKDSLAAANVFVGFSSLCHNLSNLRMAWRQAEIAALTRFFDQSARVFEYVEPATPADRTSFDQQVQKIAMLLGTGDSNGLTSCVKDFFTQAQDVAERARLLYMFHEFMITGVIRKYWELTDSDMYLNLKSIMIENIHQFESFEDYQRTVLDFLIYLDSRFKRERTEYPFITEALDYIQAHFRENLNMAMVANYVSVNYTYFSEKFKEHTGVNFNDYLKDLRINEAKLLLEKGCYKVYEVAANSGFGDAKYFMKTFKEITGLSPGEYRKKF